LFLHDFSIDPKTNSNQQQIQKRSESDTNGGARARAAEQIGKQISKSGENVSQIH
jgi:hypothetical protein